MNIVQWLNEWVTIPTSHISKGFHRMVAFKVHIPNMLNGFHVVRGIGRFVEISAKAAVVIKPI